MTRLSLSEWNRSENDCEYYYRKLLNKVGGRTWHDDHKHKPWPHHEAQYKLAENRQSFGYNHVLVVNKTEDKILSAYQMGHFYTTLLDDKLTLLNVNLSNAGLYSIEISEVSTFTFTTVTRPIITSEINTTATLQIEENDVYIRAEATRGNNKFWINAIML